MTHPTPDERSTAAIRLAIAVSGLLIGFQVAGRATRDALFLSQYPVTTLPRMVALAAIVSLLAALAMSRVLARHGPSRVVPVLLFASAGAQLAEWALFQAAPRASAALVFLHFNALGALLVSAFWSLINERFDPRTAKEAFGLVGIAGTVGGVLGGLLTERAGALLSVSAMLPALAVTHFTCAVLVRRIGTAPGKAAATRTADLRRPVSGFDILKRSSYLKLLGAALLLGTVSEGLLDYVFKDAAKRAFGGGEALLRFFALFYTGINVLGGVLSAAIGRKWLEKFGIARTVSTLPWSVAAGGVAAIAFPGLPSAVLARAGEATMRNSLYRSGFELLFTPIAPHDKRAAKPLLDVGTVRIGDMVSALLVQAALWAWLAHAPMLMLAMAVVAATANIILTFSIHRGYVTALESSLLRHGERMSIGEPALDRAARMTVARLPVMPDGLPSPVTHDMLAALPRDPALVRLDALFSPDAAVVRDALRAAPLEPAHVARAIALLARDDTSAAAAAALTAVAAAHVGQLVDALLDPDTDFVVRRRIPAVIAAAKSQRAMDGLLEGLRDPRFEVRARVGGALAHLASDAPGVRVDPSRVLAAVLEEVAVDRHVWESQHLVEDDADDPLQLGSALRERASRSLEHVFTVLSLVLPRQPLQIAFQGLHTADPQLRGTALEYLETALPPAVRERLWPFIGDRPMRPSAPARGREEVVAELMAARSSIMLNLEDVRKLDAER